MRAASWRFLSRRAAWSGQQDLNLRPSAPKADALPGCATPRLKASALVRYHVGSPIGKGKPGRDAAVAFPAAFHDDGGSKTAGIRHGEQFGERACKTHPSGGNGRAPRDRGGRAFRGPRPERRADRLPRPHLPARAEACRRAPLAQDYDATPADYLRILDENGMARGVLVQPSYLGTDGSASSSKGLPQRRRVALDYQIGGGSRHQAQAALAAIRGCCPGTWTSVACCWERGLGLMPAAAADLVVERNAAALR